MRITSKGQVTIPQEIREKAGLLPGTEVEFADDHRRDHGAHPGGRGLTVLVDSNVLIDVVNDDPVWGEWSRAALDRAATTEQLVVNPIVFAEISVGLARVEDLERALPPDAFRREHLPFEAACLAGKAFLRYRRRGGRARSPLADFYVGAHAAIRGHRLLTRDARRYRTYFPTVELLAPDQA